jgi:hypothetical protein
VNDYKNKDTHAVGESFFLVSPEYIEELSYLKDDEKGLEYTHSRVKLGHEHFNFWGKSLNFNGEPLHLKSFSGKTKGGEFYNGVLLEVDEDFSYKGEGAFLNEGSLMIGKKGTILAESIVNRRVWEWYLWSEAEKKYFKDTYGDFVYSTSDYSGVCIDHRLNSVEGRKIEHSKPHTGVIQAGSLTLNATQGEIRNSHGGEIRVQDKEGRLRLGSKGSIYIQCYKRQNQLGVERNGFEFIPSKIVSAGNATIETVEGSTLIEGSSLEVDGLARLIAGKAVSLTHMKEEYKIRMNYYNQIHYKKHFKGRVKEDCNTVENSYKVMESEGIFLFNDRLYIETVEGDIVVDGAVLLLRRPAVFKAGHDFTLNSMCRCRAGDGGTVAGSIPFIHTPSPQEAVAVLADPSSVVARRADQTISGAAFEYSGGNLYNSDPQGSITIEAGNNVNLRGSTVAAVGPIGIYANQSIHVEAQKGKYIALEQHSKRYDIVAEAASMRAAFCSR